VNRLLDEGSDVEFLSEAGPEGESRPDVLVNGVRVELKSVTTPTLGALGGALRRARKRKDKAPQALFAVIDVTDAKLSEDGVRRVLRGAREQMLRKVTGVRVMGDGFDLDYTHVNWP
jgi:hypothetical protein